ncbi:MAG: SGNH/GDSL hydrolase family protein [Candidatus Eisenbacteria bacterium]|uniref:SGNH/GDSL hydrolase family protein n=1 Tax=Eiseniibacteriota bacterium TaxID=2212470 RepID=A0A7Y2E9G8_UNCEI|nr:SGNH/GDSL hydrolase family protein [Candidatus Eisenbacteria bacterium]
MSLMASVAGISHAKDNEQPPKGLRVLFLGNSYTAYNSLPEQVRTLCASVSVNVTYEARTPGGTTLQDHAGNKDVQNLIKESRWDYLVLQEQSLRPLADPGKMFGAVKALNVFAEHNNTRLLFFETWPRRNLPSSYKELSRVYDRAAELVGGEIAPVGEAWMLAIQDHPNIKLYDPDGSHPSPAGSYLAACVISASITGEDPTTFQAPLPKGVSKSQAEKLRKVAAANRRSSSP